MGESQFDKFEPWLHHRERSTWKPVVENGDGPLTASKISGSPCLPDAQWPTCGYCGRPMQLFIQLNLSKLPKTSSDFGKGLLQFFFCTNEEIPCCANGYGDPFATCQEIRIVQARRHRAVAMPEAGKCFPPKRIVKWSKSVDRPSGPEREGMGLKYSSRTSTLRCPELRLTQNVFADDYYNWSDQLAFRGNKLGGWPAWVQNVEYVKCPKCKTLMDVLVFQIAYDDNIPFMLGDGGIGQIIQCPVHKDSLAFVWASS